MDEIDREIKECEGWADGELTRRLAEAARDERGALCTLLIRLGEFFNRDLSLKYAYPSIYDYCMRILGYSRSAAGRRIAAAKAGKKYRSVLTMLKRGELHLTGVAMLAHHLTSENHESLLGRACGKSEEEIDRLIASIAPKPVPKDRVRAIRAPAQELSSGRTGAQAATVPPSAQETDLFGKLAEPPPQRAEQELFQITFTATGETRRLLERAKEVLRHRFPTGATDAIVKLALETLLARVDRDLRRRPRRRKAKRYVSKRSRRIPEAVKQEAWERDGGQCAYVGPDGVRCTARAWLEFDHETPFALGGSSDDPAGVRPFCRPHNQWVARQAFGGPQPRSDA